jgi:DNA polymerase
MQAVAVSGLADWRESARSLLAQEIRPDEVVFHDAGQDSLFSPPPALQRTPTKVPKEFLELAADVACHRHPQRWPLLYRVLYRVTHGERHLLHIDVDPDVRELFLMQKAVKRDIHKMHAFVRFRKVENVEPEEFVAWHRPDHDIVERVGPWFARRFGAMRWTILTPHRGVQWDTHELRYGPGVPQREAPASDDLEELWRAYYASIFNPARLMVKAMKTEMPVRHWATLPETRLIPGLIAAAREREDHMRNTAAPSAVPFVPAERSLPVLQRAVQRCEGCDLFRHATQAVFGEGPQQTSVMFVGEQPGDQEDLQGHPFVGPAGALWNRALAEAGLDRDEVYVTNAVKHFKFEERGKRRIHKKPRASEVAACRPWLEAEMMIVKPKLIVALGATAALAVAGKEIAITKERGRIFPLANGVRLFVTVHPSFLLRVPDEEKESQYRQFVDDLRTVAELKAQVESRVASLVLFDY